MNSLIASLLVAAQGVEVPDTRTWPESATTSRELTPNGSVTAVTFSPDSLWLLSWHTRTRALHLHEVSSGKELRKIAYPAVTVHALAFSPDGKSLATGDTSFNASVWDVANGKVVKTFGPFEGSVTRTAFSQGGESLAVGYSAGLKIFEFATAKVIVDVGGYRWHKEGEDEVKGPTEWYSGLEFSADGRRIAAARSGPLTEKGWNATWTVRVWTPPGDGALSLKGHQSRVEALAFSPDGTRLATVSVDRTLRVWDLEKQTELFRVALADNGAPKRVLFLPGGKRLAVGMSSRFIDVRTDPAPGDFSLRIYDATSGAGLAKLRPHEGGVESLTLSPDGKTLASCGQRGPILIWDVAALSK